MTRILLTGVSGQIGWELRRALAPLGEIIPPSHAELDLAQSDVVREAIRTVRPGLIINAAAYSAVDRAESERELAMAVNGTAPGIMAEEAKRIGAALVHYSTDYVFDGSKAAPYTEEDTPDPLNVYGRTKLAGEDAIRTAGIPHLILRTSWVYGSRGRNFFLSILRLARERDELKVVADQVGTPTWSRLVAENTALILARCGFPSAGSGLTEVTGTYHLTAAGQTSWFEFAKAILKRCSVSGAQLSGTSGFASRTSCKVTPIRTEEYPAPANRPRYSVLSTAKLKSTFGLTMPPWDASLDLVAEELVPSGS